MNKKKLVEALNKKPVNYSLGGEEAVEYFSEDKKTIVKFVSDNLVDNNRRDLTEVPKWFGRWYEGLSDSKSYSTKKELAIRLLYTISEDNTRSFVGSVNLSSINSEQRQYVVDNRMMLIEAVVNGFKIENPKYVIVLQTDDSSEHGVDGCDYYLLAKSNTEGVNYINVMGIDKLKECVENEDRHVFTKEDILSSDKRYMPFAVPIAEIIGKSSEIVHNVIMKNKQGDMIK